jgi:hypothetical protein
VHARRNRIFFITLCSLLAGYLLFNLLTWNLFTRRVLADPSCNGGDLARVGYITDSIVCKQNVDDLPRRHLEEHEYTGQKIDVLTIGDSFSSGGGGGRNRYYQDHLATISGIEVLNVLQYKKLDLISTVSLLNNNGYLDRIRPGHVLIECAEKECLNDLPAEIDFMCTLSDEELERHGRIDYYRHVAALQQEEAASAVGTGSGAPFKLDFFSEANFKLVRNSILYRFADNAFFSQVYKVKLTRPLFSARDADTLLFFHKDVKHRQRITPENIARMNDYLNTLADRLADKGIRLSFMPVVDKYDLYSSYIVRNRYQESRFFEEFRKLPKRYRFIDTKALLREELERGEKDIFYADETHWSWKASRKIFETVRFEPVDRPGR